MSPITDNKAAWVKGVGVKPLEVDKGTQPNPAEDEVVIKVYYAAVNPTDWKFWETPYWEVQYPIVLGTDVAGIVVQVGSGVKRLQVGQRVIGHCDSLLTNKTTNAAFQLYSTCKELLTCPIPDSLPLSQAAVLPLSISTAASSLFVELGLAYPSLTAKTTGKTVFIWGGASSCGSSTIQLAAAAGYTVATTASKANHDYVKSLGATHIFDYRDSDVLEQIAKVLNPGDAVVDCISSQETQTACAQLLSNIGGGKFPTLLWLTGQFPENVKAVQVNGLAPGLINPEVGAAVWREYLPEALASGRLQAKPDPSIIEGGLEKVEEAIGMQKAGVSAKKIVVEIVKD